MLQVDTLIGGATTTTAAFDRFVVYSERRSQPVIERRLIPFDGEIRAIKLEDGTRQLRWYPAIFNTLSDDLGGFREKIAHGAFRKTINEADIRALFNHDPDYVLGRNTSGTLRLQEDHKGLLAEVDLPNTSFANDLIQMVERKDITGGSFAFRTIKDSWSYGESDKDIIRTLQEVRLYDVSPVTYPAYPATEGAAVRSALAEIGIELEDIVQPLFRARAGLPLDTGERDRLQRVIKQLHESLAEPLSQHSTPLKLRKRQLELLTLQVGGF